MVVLSLGKDAALQRALEPGRLRLLQGVEIVEALEKEQVGDLLDDLEGI